MKKVFITMLVLTLMTAGYFAITSTSTETATASAAVKPYSAIMYVAGMGGHFSVADITIDPNDTDHPIRVNNLDMLDIGGKSYPTHDARIDNTNRSVLYWSTYKDDNWKEKGNGTGKLHVGKSDLETGNVLVDVAFDVPERAKWIGANYCASGQSEKFYMPVSMANEGYIDVIDKNSMKLKHRVFFDDLGIKSGETTFAHGINTPDMKAFLLTVNLTPEGHTKWTGNTRLIMLDMAALEQGKVKKLQEATITGRPMDASGGTITFRQYFSDDGRYFFQSGADRGYLIDAKTLKVLDEITPLPGENHDIIPTPDGKYAVMTLRETVKNSAGEEIKDGTLLLYDVEAKKTIGKTTSVCYGCHKANDMQKSAVLCGIDANWK